MKITQHYYEPLSQAGYVLSSDGEALIIDPLRNFEHIVEEIDERNLHVKGIILTHPHADFVSGHRELAKKYDVPIYMHSSVKPTYKITPFDQDDIIELCNVTVRSLHTPGHSPDSISIVVTEKGADAAIFTGDTLFVGDVGRPDLRESEESARTTRESLARDMYKSTREKLLKLGDNVAVYPAHGAGTLCGKNLGDERTSTIGKERKDNPALQEMTEEQFVEFLLDDQPFIPEYFAYDVKLNKAGDLKNLEETINNLKPDASNGVVVVDIRSADDFRSGHSEGAINIPAKPDDKFETWAGSIVRPNEPMVIYGATLDEIKNAVKRLGNIGYESNVRGYILHQNESTRKGVDVIGAKEVYKNQADYTIVDVRNTNETEQAFFENSISIPLHQLRKNLDEVPSDKPVAVHCAGGYRSSIGASILASADNKGVYDISKSITELNSSKNKS